MKKQLIVYGTILFNILLIPLNIKIENGLFSVMGGIFFAFGTYFFIGMLCFTLVKIFSKNRDIRDLAVYLITTIFFLVALIWDIWLFVKVDNLSSPAGIPVWEGIAPGIFFTLGILTSFNFFVWKKVSKTG